MSNTINQIPTSSLEDFKKQLANPNTNMQMVTNQNNSGIKYNQQSINNLGSLKKDIILSIKSDSSGVGHIRNIHPLTYLGSIFGKTGNFDYILTPIPIFDPLVLLRTRVVLCQRFMSPESVAIVQKYKELQSKYSYRIFYELDDYIWNDVKNNPLECIPDYNFGSLGVQEKERKASIEIMKLCDKLIISTPFLANYISTKLNIKTPIELYPNAVPIYLWGTNRKRPITKKIEIPKIINTSSATHFQDKLKLKGDFEYFAEWVIKNVKDKKIMYYQLGTSPGSPFFFDSIRGHSNYKEYPWADSYSYPNIVKSVNADFSIGPLVPNFFNFSKSNLKFLESMISGSVFLGAVFDKNDLGHNSPYDICSATFPYNDMNKLDEMIWKLTEPEEYNKILKEQYRMLDDNGYILESAIYINKLVKLLSSTA